MAELGEPARSLVREARSALEVPHRMPELSEVLCHNDVYVDFSDGDAGDSLSCAMAWHSVKYIELMIENVLV